MAPMPPPLVWVTQGKTQHLAFLLEELEEGEALIRWQSTGKSEKVLLNDICRNLLPRRRRRPEAFGTPQREGADAVRQTGQESRRSGKAALTTNSSRGAKKRKSPTNAAQRVTPRETPKVQVDTSYLSSSDDSGEDDDDDDYSIGTQEDVLLADLAVDNKTQIASLRADSEVLVLQEVQPEAESEVVGRQHAVVSTSAPAEEKEDATFLESFQIRLTPQTHCSPRAGLEASTERSITLEDDASDVEIIDVEATIVAQCSPRASQIETAKPVDALKAVEARVDTLEQPIAVNEVLSTISSQKTPISLEHAEASGDASGPNHPSPVCEAEGVKYSEPSANLAEPSAGPTTDTSTDDDVKPSYTFKSSAYVQNLAEICDTILSDRRWRVRDGASLFAWENGDDLSAVTRLSQLYQRPPPVKRRPCTCLLCRESKQESHTIANEEEQPMAEQEVMEDGDDADSRALNLYCRLYYRKGPWFRVDDIFTKYYAPKRQPVANASDSQEQAAKASITSDAIDGDLLQEAIKKMSQMLSDVNQLCHQGLLRTFNDEKECGKMAGSVSPEGGGVVLNADERRSVLQKLGGSKKKGRRESRGEKKSVNPRENQIWKQMCQQQSIASGMLLNKGNQNDRHLLPVRHHVNQEILTKLATSVVMAASCVEYVPAALMRAKLLEVKKSLSAMTDQRSTQSLNFSKLDTAVRLREAPLTTLRRCCRLYLCATGGPGNMRGDGTNGWKSLRDCLGGNVSLPMARLVPQPGDNTWNSTVYPGLASRFGLTHCAFVDAYRELRGVKKASSEMEQVFADLASFRLWELAAEIRANIDYVVELNEMILYDERKKARVVDEDDDGLPRRKDVESFLLCGEEQGEKVSKLNVDFLQILDRSVRRGIVSQFCACLEAVNEKGEGTEEIVVNEIEDSIAKVFVENENLGDDVKVEDVVFRTDCEKVIVVVGVIATAILRLGYQHMSQAEKELKARRCWMRHLWFEGVLAYVLWDCIPILEKRGMYRLASRGLEVLVFGSFQPDSWRLDPEIQTKGVGWGASIETTGDIMISRRARGKAIERLMIDYIHMLRKELKDQEAERLKCEETTSKSKKKKKILSPTAADTVNSLCGRVLAVASKSGFISFAAIRALARRTKKPLDQVLESGSCREANELGLRLMDTSVQDPSIEAKGYADWTPKTDQAVAISMKGPANGVGSRCSYVGFEDANNRVEASSLNVEELAMEYYATGRLPVGDEQLGGGSWVGWHDEGGRLRTLFRILCACPVLGMDGGCGSNHDSESPEHATVHLTKYQGAPFDLHVGSWSHLNNAQSVSGFYNRRKDRINNFLAKLASCSPQDLADCVYEAIQARAASKARGPNVVLTNDIHQLRTLSMVAAGFGGKHLAAAFRCMLFDYRHYSGGLPDLLMARALYSGTTNGTKEFVDIGEWVGEAFSEEARAEREAENRSNLLIDKDDEFLGCSKVGDSGTSRSTNRWNRQQTRRQPPPSIPELPPRLVLSHNNRPIEVQCMFVEVKSQNDRLDGRQEDWLNVLDSVGYARVCKFVSNKKPKKTKRGQPKATDS